MKRAIKQMSDKEIEIETNKLLSKMKINPDIEWDEDDYNDSIEDFVINAYGLEFLDRLELKHLRKVIVNYFATLENLTTNDLWVFTYINHYIDMYINYYLEESYR